MRISARFSMLSRLCGAVTAIWLCAAGPASAGSGASAEGLQMALLDPLCSFLGVASCPQLPTVAQIVEEVSALENIPPNLVRSQIIGVSLGLDQSSGACTVAGNFGFVPCDTLAVNAINPLASSSIGPSDLSQLTPLAFNSKSGQVVVPVPLGTSGQNSFFYAVLTGESGQHKLDLFIDYPLWTARTFTIGQVLATISFPMVILNGAIETPVSATLQVTAACAGGVAACLSGTVSGIPGTGTTPLSAAQLGIQLGFSFAASPNSATQHGIFEVQLPVIVTQSTDPAHFGVSPVNSAVTLINQASGLPTAFSKNDVGVTPSVLGKPIGVPPYPGPLCTAATCPANPPTPPTTFYGFCASIANTPAAAAFASVGTDGTAYAVSQIAAPQPQCPQ
jgi:hypothetical protein